MASSLQSLAERMQAVKERANTSTRSDCKQPTSLETYLRIYNKAIGEGSCYTDYMAGAKALAAYLAPIEVPTDLAIAKLSIPPVFHSYEVGQIAKIITGETYGGAYNYVCSLIVYYTAKHIIENAQLR